jgi:hypothetical protein
MIAVCTNCKLIFEDRGIVIQDSINVTISNSSTTCPKCRSRAKYLDGTFNFDSNGIISVLSAPQFTIEILNRIKSIVVDVQNRKISPEDFHKEVDALPPVIRSVLKLVIPKEASGFWAMIGTLLIVLNQLIGPKDEKTSEQVIGITETKIELQSQKPPQILVTKRDSIPKIDDSAHLDKK